MPKKAVFVFLIVILIIVACSTAPPANEAGQVEVTRLVEVEVTRLVEVEVTRLVETIQEIEVTAVPTEVPEPTAAPEVTEKAITLTGSGDAIVDVEKWDGAAVLHTIAAGDGDTVEVERYDAEGKASQLVGGKTPYDGMTTMDMGSSTTTTRFSVKAPGEWTLEILPMSDLPTLSIPGKLEGTGRTVVALTGETPDIATVTADENGLIFSVTAWGYGSGGRLFYADNGSLVSEFDLPFEGDAVVSDDTAFLEISHEGNWSIDITAK